MLSAAGYGLRNGRNSRRNARLPLLEQPSAGSHGTLLRWSEQDWCHMLCPTACSMHRGEEATQKLPPFKKPPSLCKSAGTVVKHQRRLTDLHRRLETASSFPSFVLSTGDASRGPIHISSHGLLERFCTNLTSRPLSSSQAPADNTWQTGFSLNRSSPHL